jgi:predicted negative regulator of RcsB-dependent stress response
MNMSEENPPHSVPDAGRQSPADSSSAEVSPLADREYRPLARRNPNRRRNVVILVAVVVVLVAGFFLWRWLNSYESTDDAQADVHLYPVSARVSGYVVRVNVDDNQWVEKGTVLVEIDPKDYEVAVAQAQANFANAEATAQSLNLTVPITSVNSSSQLRFTASGVDDANAGVIAAERQLTAAHDSSTNAKYRSKSTIKHWPRPNRARLRSRRRAPVSPQRSNSCNRPAPACRRPKPTINMRRPGRSRFRRPRLACGRRSPMWSKSARLSNRHN